MGDIPASLILAAIASLAAFVAGSITIYQMVKTFIEEGRQ